MSHRCGGVRLSHPLDTLAAVVLWCVHCQQVYMIRIWRFEESHIEATAAAGWMNTFPKMLNFSFKSFLLLLWSNSCSVGQVNVADFQQRRWDRTVTRRRGESARLPPCDLLKKKYGLNDREVEVRQTESAHIVLLKLDTNPHSLSSRNEPVRPLKLSTLGSY